MSERAALDAPSAWVRAHPDLASALCAERRVLELDEVAGASVDVVVVGGGITGAGVALDAAARGLSVVLLERLDLASGTSRWSSKMIHGGLRYLASGHVGIAYESASERALIMGRLAPHLVHALPQVVPATPDVGSRAAALVHTGLLAGDVLRRAARTERSLLPHPRRVTTAEALVLAPALRRNGLRGGMLSWDGQLVDDARLVVAVARTAAARSARVLTRCEVEAVDGTRVAVRDRLSGAGFGVTARTVINACGVWADRLSPTVRLRPSKGTHVVLRSSALGGARAGITVPVQGERNRWVFTLPTADGLTLLGLTDDPVDGPVPDVPQPEPAEVRFLLDTLNRALDRPLDEDDVAGSFAGLRPLLDSGTGATADLSRSHRVVVEGPLVTVVGGKLTTYRRMAVDAVDAAVRSGGLRCGGSVTARLPLVGAAPRPELDALRLPPRLVSRFGVEAPLVARLLREEPELAGPMAPEAMATSAEARFAITHEGALDAEDVVDRRLRLDLVRDQRQAALPVAERLVAERRRPARA